MMMDMPSSPTILPTTVLDHRPGRTSNLGRTKSSNDTATSTTNNARSSAMTMLESLTNQLYRMQQVQDRLSKQKETEFNLLRTKMEVLKMELARKEGGLVMRMQERLKNHQTQMMDQQEQKQLTKKELKAGVTKMVTFMEGKQQEQEENNNHDESKHQDDDEPVVDQRNMEHETHENNIPPLSGQEEKNMSRSLLDVHPSTTTTTVIKNDMTSSHDTMSNTSPTLQSKSNNLPALPEEKDDGDGDDSEDHLADLSIAHNTTETFDHSRYDRHQMTHDGANRRNINHDDKEQDDDDDTLSVGSRFSMGDESAYGEDRRRVKAHVYVDVHGDKGLYTGIIIKSTGHPHGLGRMVYVNGNGEYDQDERMYDGDWSHGRYHGFGQATFANGDSYEGEHRKDKRHGKGKYMHQDGRVYIGDFREDIRHGKGTYTWPDGSTYKGDFFQGYRQGQGRFTFADGSYYVGSFVAGHFEGFGEFHWDDGSKYQGEWRDGKANGRGIEIYADGSIRHDGQWVDDEPVRSQGRRSSDRTDFSSYGDPSIYSDASSTTSSLNYN